MTRKKITPKPSTLPILPLRDTIPFPGTIIPLFVAREASMAALRVAEENRGYIFLATQFEPELLDPTLSDLYPVGTRAKILQLLQLPDETLKVLVDVDHRGEIASTQPESTSANGYLAAEITFFQDEPVRASHELRALINNIHECFSIFLDLYKKIPNEISRTLKNIEDLTLLIDSIATQLPLSIEKKYDLLKEVNLSQRARLLLMMLAGEIERLEIEQNIRQDIKSKAEKHHRDYYLREQIHALKKELGEDEEIDEIENFHQRIIKKKCSHEAKEKCLSELKKLRQMSPISAEAHICRNYIETLLELPWSKHSRINKDLNKAEAILDAEHYGLEKVKERILEYLAVQQRVKKVKSQLLCLVGPPGVGKTSLAASIAKATGRPYVRVALGGVRDEAEIRGHRRTYLGAMPGKIIQKLTKAGANNPLFLLDEVDKMSMDFRGDPASALLEVLDPEQNHTFNDHFLEVDYDLSHVMFLATANTENLPPALLDRMEIIRIPGYTEHEKKHIAKEYLIKKQCELNGIKNKELFITDDALIELIRTYTREAGVRALDRSLAKIARKVVYRQQKDPHPLPITIDKNNLNTYLGIPPYRYGQKKGESHIGQVTGLAWTGSGGELLTLEVALIDGKGKIESTGSLGEVMQESIKAAWTVARKHAKEFGLSPGFYEKHDVHIHVPEGAIPKDGPSAGIGICTALISALTEKPVASNLAMTGEITLSGEVLAIGGLKEKLLAAVRGEIRKVYIPKDNVKDLSEIPKDITEQLHITPVESIDEVFQSLFPKKKKAKRVAKAKPSVQAH